MFGQVLFYSGYPFPFLANLPVQDLQRLHSASLAELDSVTLTKIRWELLD